MKTKKKAGIWMDHSIANLIDLNTQKHSHSIVSKYTYNKKEAALNRSKSLVHCKERQMHKPYYKEIADAILKYDTVLLFGPTNAKTELHNYLNTDLNFKDIKIDIESTDKMTYNQQDAFVKKYYNN
ncbi:hypothetical protein [Patiriisocius sp. Uisw_017]|jgi:stalled ribosome rescue protein Dom34|uniref:hypothetical protein n=1 Tax=Patiriisocius sp. Uisw_017 TaxID=3230968 RepID=UPI0039E868B6